jgi:hypothetical protein
VGCLLFQTDENTNLIGNDVLLSLLFTSEWFFVLLNFVCGQYVCYTFHMKSLFKFLINSTQLTDEISNTGLQSELGHEFLWGEPQIR